MIRLLGAILLLSGAPGALAQGGLPDFGRKIASESCGTCHEVEGAAPTREKGPSFASIAKMPSTTELSIKVFLQSSHRNMPNLILSPDEIDALTAYIVGLK
jgi:mono/diheme cytochrome c family protein